MRRELQREIIRTALDLAASAATQMADAPLVLSVSDYLSPAMYDLERRMIFRERPVVACLSCDLREPGDHIATESGGVPLLVVRQSDGSLRAFVNICRHRGSPIAAPGLGHVSRSFACTFHGWAYDLDGRNINRPHSSGGFDDIDGGDSACFGLLARPVAEAHGFVWVRAEGDTPIDIDALLCGMGDELDAFAFGDFHRFGATVTEWDANWKLLADTFLETYHVPALHPKTVGRHFLARPSMCRAFGPNIRFHSLMKTLLDMRDTPESTWELLPHGTVEYLIAPNTIVNYTVDHVALYQFVALSPERTRVVLTLYTPHPVHEDADVTNYRRTLDLHMRVSGGEDFTKQEQVHRSLASGAMPDVVFGRNEPGAILFHTGLHALLES